MALFTETTLSATLTAAGTQNRPLICHTNYADSVGFTTTLGTEVQPANNAASRATYNFWEASPDTGRTALHLTMAGGAQSVGYVGIAAHNLGETGCTVRAQYSSDDATWMNAATASTPTDGTALAWRFTPISAEYWRIYITGLSGNNSRLGVVMLGNELLLPHDIYGSYMPALTQTNVELQSNVSEGGHLLGNSVVRKSSTASANIQYGTPDYFRSSDWLAFQEDYNAGQGFFWSWRPGDYTDLHYAWRSGKPLAPSNTSQAGLMSVGMGMRLYDDP